MLVEYKYRKTEFGDPQECDSCGSIAPVEEFEEDLPKKQKRLLCELCANSCINYALECPEQHTDPQIFKAIAQVGNMILDKITGRHPLGLKGERHEQ